MLHPIYRNSVKHVHATHNEIRTLIESGYSVFLLKIPLFQRIYATFNNFEAELVELNLMFAEKIVSVTQILNK